MTDGGVAGYPLRERDCLGRGPSCAQPFGALVREVEARAHLQHSLSEDVESEMTRLDHPRMHGTDRNLVHAFPFHGRERKRTSVIAELRCGRIVPQRMKRLGPEAMADERSRIGVPHRRDAQQIAHLALEPRNRK